jgi:hypothetical protein
MTFQLPVHHRIERTRHAGDLLSSMVQAALLLIKRKSDGEATIHSRMAAIAMASGESPQELMERSPTLTWDGILTWVANDRRRQLRLMKGG